MDSEWRAADFVFKPVFPCVFRHGGGIYPVEAGAAIAAPRRRPKQVVEPVQGKVPQAVRADELCNFLLRPAAGDEGVPGIDVRPVISRV